MEITPGDTKAGGNFALLDPICIFDVRRTDNKECFYSLLCWTRSRAQQSTFTNTSHKAFGSIFVLDFFVISPLKFVIHFSTVKNATF